MRLILFLLPALAFAQLDDNTITVSASRPLAVQPDQAVIGIDVEMPITSTLDDVLAALKDVGVTAADLSHPIGVLALIAQIPAIAPPPVDWPFTLSVPLANLTTTLATLDGLSRTNANGAATSLSYNLQGTQISPAAQATNPCSYPALLSDAQKQAQALAQAAGGSVGAIVAISDQPPSGAVPSAVILEAQYSGQYSFISNPFTGSSGLASFLLGFAAPAPPSPSPSCSLTVQFQLHH